MRTMLCAVSIEVLGLSGEGTPQIVISNWPSAPSKESSWTFRP
jgi:hypothetical protein